jgi:SAM-dependent methyltransferase
VTFLKQSNVSRSAPALGLSQRGRAGVEFLGAVQSFSSGALRRQARSDFETDPDGAAIIEKTNRGGVNEPWSERNAKTREVAERYSTYLFERFLQRFVAEEVYMRGIPAVEEKREQFEAYWKDAGPDIGGTLELDPSVKIPDYYQNVEWHLEPDGWDGYDLYGTMFAFVAGPHIFKHGGYAAVEQGDNIIEQRMSFIRQLPRKSYGRIYEMGCGGVSTLACAREVFPDAELVGSDLSPLLLRMGHITANRLGVKAHFKQRDSRNSGEPDASFDAVLSYAVMHEAPPAAGRELLREAYRILKPGGDIVISDPPPFKAVDPLQAVILDWDTQHRGEPFFTAACETDWGDVLREIGFVNVESYALGKRGYPWINRASKPL